MELRQRSGGGCPLHQSKDTETPCRDSINTSVLPGFEDSFSIIFCTRNFLGLPADESNEGYLMVVEHWEGNKKSVSTNWLIH